MTLPNFLIIGAPKAGTSSLYHYLNQHPQIYMSPEKEPHFFHLDGKVVDFQGPGDDKRFSQAITSLEDYAELFKSVTIETAIGEASTTYLSSEQAPYKIKDYVPKAKLIVILRNPVDAAYASFLHLLRDGDETVKNFDQALQLEKQRIEQNWEGIWHYQARGFYYPQLKRYFELFNPQQIQVYRYEDFRDQTLETFAKILAFLEVDASFRPDLSQKHNVSGMPKNQILNQMMSKPNPVKSTFNLLMPKSLRKSIQAKVKSWNFNDFKKPTLSAQVRELLTKGYEEDILKLQDLIQQDLSSWTKVS